MPPRWNPVCLHTFRCTVTTCLILCKTFKSICDAKADYPHSLRSTGYFSIGWISKKWELYYKDVLSTCLAVSLYCYGIMQCSNSDRNHFLSDLRILMCGVLRAISTARCHVVIGYGVGCNKPLRYSHLCVLWAWNEASRSHQGALWEV